MAGIVLSSGSTSITMSDGLRRYVDHMLGQAIPSLRPSMERLIREAVAEVKDKWPDGSARRTFEADKRQAVAQASRARRAGKKAGKRIKGISFWDYMPYQYPPPGYRSTGRSRQAWRAEIRIESGPTIVAAMINDTKKGGAPYPYMAKLPPPLSNKTYLRVVAIPAIKDREDELLDRLEADLDRLAAGTF